MRISEFKMKNVVAKLGNFSSESTEFENFKFFSPLKYKMVNNVDTMNVTFEN